MLPPVIEPLRIGNASGFYGDRESAVREMLTGGDLDVLTGDYLAELTMLILARDRMKDPGRGYARSFLRPMEDGLGPALDPGVEPVPGADTTSDLLAHGFSEAEVTALVASGAVIQA